MTIGELRVGVKANNATGTLTLPTAEVIVSTARGTGDVYVGGGTSGVLNLGGATLSVGDLFQVGTTGTVNSTLGATTGGVDSAQRRRGRPVRDRPGQRRLQQRVGGQLGRP